ncbi:MAG: hypothetical protein RLZZ210_1582 [Pseudomonadota bacterium]
MQNKQDKLPLSTYLLSLAQTINLTMAVLSVSIGAVVGIKLAPSIKLSTVPYGIQFLMVMLFSYLASSLMKKKGRAFTFYLACIFLFCAGIMGYLAVIKHNFIFMCIAHALLGIYISCANFYRFAATDNLSNNLKSKAISFVIFGGVLAGILGPFLAQNLKNLAGYIEFSLCYGIMSVFALLNILVIFIWQRMQSNVQKQNITPHNIKHNNHELAVDDVKFSLPIIISAVITSSIGYLVMNLIMIQSSLVMKNMCSFSESSTAIQAHVLAMFLPSFITGKLINKFGVWTITHLSFLLLALSSLWGIYFLDYNSVFIELIILGLGWNFGYVAGSSLLTLGTPEAIKHKVQGINDSLIAFSATIGAFSPSFLYISLGWKSTHILITAICIIVFVANLFIHHKVKKNHF